MKLDGRVGEVIESLDTLDADTVIETLEEAAQCHLRSRLRKGALVRLPGKGRLLMTGDLHDHTANFQRILALADLEGSPDNHLIIHEVVHGKNIYEGRDQSIEILAKVAALKIEFPEQVHVFLSNHELAQVTGEGVGKDGADVIQQFDRGLDYLYGEAADDVRFAMNEYVRSFPLAVRTDSGLFCCHSLPSPDMFEKFDRDVIHRVPKPEDYDVEGSAHLMVWGRNQDIMHVDDLARSWNAELFIVGHQTAERGHKVHSDRMLILASDHQRGVALPLDLWQAQSMEKLVSQIVPLKQRSSGT